MKKINYTIISIGFISIVINLIFHAFGFYSLIENKLYDTRFKLRGPLSNLESKIVLVEIDDEEEVLSPWGLMQEEHDGTMRLAKELLPKVLITDPVIQVIKEKVEALDAANSAENPDHTPLPAGWLADRVLKIIRPSPSAGFTVAYRLIVESN